MADKAEIKVTLDSRQAQAEAAKQAAELKKAEARRAKLKKRADAVARRVRRGGAAGGSTGRGGGLGRGLISGVVGARVAGQVGALAAGAKVVGGTALAAAAATVGAAEVGVKVAEVLPALLAPLLEGLSGGEISAAITDEVADAMDGIRQAIRFEALTSQAASLNFLPIAGQFARAGDAFSSGEANNLSEQLVRASRRASFLSRQESRRATIGISKALVQGVIKGRGE